VTPNSLDYILIPREGLDFSLLMPAYYRQKCT